MRLSRRVFLAASASSLLVSRSLAASAAPASRPHRELIFKTGGDGNFHAVIINYVTFSEDEVVTAGHSGASIGVDQAVSEEPLPGPAVNSQELYDAAIAQAKADNGDLEVDPDAQFSDYQFGSAGGLAAAGVFGYGIAADLAGLGAQQERITELKQRIDDLNAAIKLQLAQQANAASAISEAIASHGAALTETLKSVSSLPSIHAADPSVVAADGRQLFATPDAFLALRLARTSQTIVTSPPNRLPYPLGDFGLAALRQADVESAVGDSSLSRPLLRIARTIADVGVGIDPVTGVVRSVYELWTGKNLITGEDVGDVGRGLAALNLITIGGFGAFGKGAAALAKIAKVLGGERGRVVIALVSRMGKSWPIKTITKVLGWRSTGRAITEEAEIVLRNGRELVPVGAVDGWYARVMERGQAEQLLEGGLLSRSPDRIAFVTDRATLSGTSSAKEIATKLSSFRPDAPKELVDLSNHVVVEFKFASSEPIAFLASPFGEVGTFGPAFVPGGYTLGGAPEWVIDSGAVAKGLIDKVSIVIRDIHVP